MEKNIESMTREELIEMSLKKAKKLNFKWEHTFELIKEKAAREDLIKFLTTENMKEAILQLLITTD